jgi:hypothetical protein
MTWFNYVRLSKGQPSGNLDSPFDLEMIGIVNHIIKERGSPTRFLRVQAAQYVTGVKDPADALKSYSDYLRYLSEPNLILSFPTIDLPWLKAYAVSDDLYDPLWEHYCEMLRRYYSSYQADRKREAAKKIKKKSLNGGEHPVNTLLTRVFWSRTPR